MDIRQANAYTYSALVLLSKSPFTLTPFVEPHFGEITWQ